MRAVVVYESMYGNTHQVAETIANGLAGAAEVEVLSLEEAMPGVLRSADLVVVGGPTHAHGMSRASTRTAAVAAAEKKVELELDPDAPGPGLREWLDGLPQCPVRAAAFDTRVDAPAFFTGRASKGIARQLRKKGFDLIVEPESFLVTKDNILVEGEVEHAKKWAETIASKLSTVVQ